MAKRDPATPTDDDSADEVANQFSAPPKSQSNSKIESKAPSSLKKAGRPSRQAEVVEASNSEEEEPAAALAGAEESDEKGSEDGEDEEYEIEKILEVKVGAIPESPDELCYYVHWKGYGDEDDSWTTESNAEGARELIRVFWKSRKRAGKRSRDELIEAHKAKKAAHKKSARKSNATPSAKKGRASSIAASSEDLGEVAMKRSSAKNGAKGNSSSPLPPTTTKRRRSSVPKQDAMDVDEDEEPAEKPKSPMEEDEDTAPPPKKRKASSSARNGSHKAKKDEAADEEPAAEISDVDGADALIKRTLAKYGKLKSWDDIIAEITTVEQRASDDKLQIFFKSTDGIDCLAVTQVFSVKSPRKLIDFYESNLKWRPSET